METDMDELDYDTKVAECLSCGYETKLSCYGTIKYRSGDSEDKWLCKLCANTLIPNYLEYPGRYNEEAMINGRALIYAMNMILDKLNRIEKMLNER